MSREQLEYLLKKSPQHRSKPEIDLLVEMTQMLPFFRQYMKQENGIQIQRKCCKNMYCEKFKGNEVVFYVDSVGTKFYIILEGSVSVLVRKPGQTEMEAVRTLNKGDSFGELALIHKQPRLATIQCLTDCTFAVLDKAQFKHILQEEQQKQLDENIDYFSQIKIFSQLHRTQLKHIYLNSFLYEFDKNQIVVKEGQRAENFYLIKSGCFLVKKMMNHTYINLFEISELQVFGFYHLNNNLPYEYTLVCNTSKGYAYKISRTSLVERMFEHQNEDFKQHRMEINTLAQQRTSTDVKTASQYPQYFCKRIKTEQVPEKDTDTNELIQSYTPRNWPIKNIRKQRMSLLKSKMDQMAQKIRKPPVHVSYEMPHYTPSELFLKTHKAQNFSLLMEQQQVRNTQPQQQQQQQMKNKKQNIKTHIFDDQMDKHSCDSPLSSTHTQRGTIAGLKRVFITSVSKIKPRTVQSYLTISPLIKTTSCILQQKQSIIMSSTNNQQQ